MRFAFTLKDDTLDTLTTRVYELGADPAASLVRDVRRALTAANPYLTSIDRVPVGTVVAVPEIDGVAFGADTHAADQVATSVSAAQLAGIAGLTQTTISAVLDAQAADARASAALLRSAPIRKLARGDERLGEALPALLKVATARTDDAKSLQGYTRESFAQLDADLAELADSFG
jgi:hypothetical protein